MLTYYTQSCSLIPLTMQYFCNTHQVDFVYNPHTHIYVSFILCYLIDYKTRQATYHSKQHEGYCYSTTLLKVINILVHDESLSLQFFKRSTANEVSQCKILDDARHGGQEEEEVQLNERRSPTCGRFTYFLPCLKA